jgi:hypothetical protein
MTSIVAWISLVNDVDPFQKRVMPTQCAICREIGGEPDNRLAATLQGLRVHNAVWSQTEHLQVIPSVGALVTGHSLVVPFAHTYSVVAAADWSLLRELAGLVQSYRRTAEEIVGHPLALLCFEHGSLGCPPRRVLCSTEHAHVHMLPMDQDCAASLVREVFGERALIADLDEIACSAKRLPEHLACWVVQTDGTFGPAGVLDASALPSQYMRMRIADSLNLGEWDWRVEPRAETLLATLKLGFAVNVQAPAQLVGVSWESGESG